MAPEVPGLPGFRWDYGIHWVPETLGVLGVPEFHQDPELPGVPAPQKTVALELMKALG